MTGCWSVMSMNVNRTIHLKGTVGMLPEYKIMVAFLTEGPSRCWGSRQSCDVPALFRGSSSYSARNQMYRSFRYLFLSCFPFPWSFPGLKILVKLVTFTQWKESWFVVSHIHRKNHTRPLLLNMRDFGEQPWWAGASKHRLKIEQRQGSLLPIRLT